MACSSTTYACSERCGEGHSPSVRGPLIKLLQSSTKTSQQRSRKAVGFLAGDDAGARGTVARLVAAGGLPVNPIEALRRVSS